MEKKIILKSGSESLLIIDINDIIYFEKEKKLIKIAFKNRKEFSYIKMTMKKLKEILENEKIYNIHFIRSHCSYIVNINHVKRIYSNKILVSNNLSIPISYSNSKSIYNLMLSNFIKIL